MQVVSGEKNAPQEWKLRAAKVLHLNLLNVCFLCDHVRYLPVYLWKDKLKRAGKDIFVELLRVLAGRQELDLDVDGEDQVTIIDLE